MSRMTIARAAALALDVQDACNLSGVVRSFALVTEALWEEARRTDQGTEWVNQHPVSVLFVNKMDSLVRDSGEKFSRAYDECEKLARGERT